MSSTPSTGPAPVTYAIDLLRPVIYAIDSDRRCHPRHRPVRPLSSTPSTYCDLSSTPSTPIDDVDGVTDSSGREVRDPVATPLPSHPTRGPAGRLGRRGVPWRSQAKSRSVPDRLDF